MSEKTIVVLGGGVGGVVAANELRNRLKDRADIVLVDRSTEQSFGASYLWVVTGERTPKAITRDITRLERKGVKVVAGEVQGFDLAGHSVTVDGKELAYDFLIVALGAELDFEAVPGLGAASTFYNLEGAGRLHKGLAGFKGGHVVLAIGGTPYKCPAAPYEAAMLLEGYFHSRQMRHNVELAIYTPEPAPMPVAGPELGAAVQEMLAHKGIAFHQERPLAAVEGGGVRFEDGSTAAAELLITVPPHRAPKVVRDSDLADDSGWIVVDRHTLETKHEGVFAIGDVTRIELHDGMMLPKAGVFAHGEAEVVARNIAARILGQAKRHSFDGKGYCFLEAGGGVAGMAQGDFYGNPRRIGLKPPSPVWHWGKVALERYWLWKWY